MRFSVEAREPFLDVRLVEALLNTDDALKIKNGVTKYIMREGLKGILPEKIRNRNSKIGFETPAGNWFREEKFKAYIFSILKSESFSKRPYFNQQRSLELFQQHLDRKIEISKEIWKWINVELWCRQFIDQKTNS
jgi:asparagine synthase (glutamine-hydrolysing)